MKVSAFSRQCAGLAACLVILLSVVQLFFAPSALAQSPQINLSTRKAGELLNLPTSDWTHVNRFVFLIAVDNEELSIQFKQLQVYPELNRSCVKWKDTTFISLQQLAQRLSKGEIRRLLIELQSALDKTKTDPRGAEQAFNATYESLKTELGALDTLSKGVASDLDTFTRLTDGALLQYKQLGYDVNSPVGVSRIVVAQVQAALGAMNGQWGAISADLERLNGRIKRELATNDPDLRQLSVDFGLESWKNLETSANKFLTDVPEQQRNLSGDYYYDLVPISQNFGYEIWNKWLLSPFGLAAAGGPYVLDTFLQNNMVRLQMVQNQSKSNRPKWYFIKAGAGWWNIVSLARGRNEVLSVVQIQNSYLVAMVNKGGVRPIGGQLWRIVPAEFTSPILQLQFPEINNDNYRIYNAFLGHSQSLKVAGINGRIGMDKTDKNALDQVWVLKQ
jgi:hypothetical protein